MEKGNITEEEILQLKAILINSLAKRSDKNYQRDNKNSSVWRSYSTGSRVGQQVYRSFTDEQLLNYLVKTARDLNHAPSQKEMFWVLRDYIKLRFGKWPYALKKAGLSNSAGKGSLQDHQDQKPRLVQEYSQAEKRNQVLLQGTRLQNLRRPEGLHQVVNQSIQICKIDQKTESQEMTAGNRNRSIYPQPSCKGRRQRIPLTAVFCDFTVSVTSRTGSEYCPAYC